MPLVRARLADGRTARLATRDPSVPPTLAPSVTGVVGLSTDAVDDPSPRPSDRAADWPRSPGPATAAAARHVGGPQACCRRSASLPDEAWTATQLAADLRADHALRRRTGRGRPDRRDLRARAVHRVGHRTPTRPATAPTSRSPTVDVDGGAVRHPGRRGRPRHRGGGRPGPRCVHHVYSGSQQRGDRADRHVQRDGDRRHGQGAIDQLGPVRADDGPVRAAGRRNTRSSPEAAAQGQTVARRFGRLGIDATATRSARGQDRPGRRRPGRPARCDRGGRDVARRRPPPTRPTESGVERATVDGGAGGGGNSTDFAAPSWQQVPAAQSAHTDLHCGPSSDRAVPRGARRVGLGRPAPRRRRLLRTAVGGRSAAPAQAAPLWAALVADINQGCATPAGLARPDALRHRVDASDFNDVTAGDNDLFGDAPVPGTVPATTWPRGGGAPRPAPCSGLLSGSAAGCPTVTGLNPSSGPAGRRHDRHRHRVRVRHRSPRPSASAGRPARSSSPTGRHRSPWSPRTCTSGRPARSPSPPPARPRGTEPGRRRRRSSRSCRPEVTSVVADHGPIDRWRQVTIAGSDFAGATSVTFGGDRRHRPTRSTSADDHHGHGPGRAAQRCPGRRRRGRRPSGSSPDALAGPLSTTPCPATGWSPPTAACSTTGTPASSARPAA